jgi:hypothetical protein
LKRNGDGRLFDLERPRLFLVGELAPALGGTQHHLTVARPEGPSARRSHSTARCRKNFASVDTAIVQRALAKK